MNVTWDLSRKLGHETLCFSGKVAAAGDEGQPVCDAGAGRSCFLFPHFNGGLKLLWMRLLVRSSRVFWNLWLQIAVEWLHDCSHVLLPCAMDVAWGLRWGGSQGTKP